MGTMGRLHDGGAGIGHRCGCPSNEAKLSRCQDRSETRRLRSSRPGSMSVESDFLVRDSPTQSPKSPNPTLGSRRSTSSVGKAVKAAPATATKKLTISDVATAKLIAAKRDPQDRRRIILSYARQIKQDGLASADKPDSQKTVHSPGNLRRKTFRSNLQAVKAATRRYLIEAKSVAAFKHNLFETRFALTLGVLLKEDSSMDKLKTTLETLATETEFCAERTAQKLREMPAKLDEVKGMQEQCSSLISHVRLIPGRVFSAYANRGTSHESMKHLEAELNASKGTLRVLSMMFKNLESEYFGFCKTFMSFQPKVLPVCCEGRTMVQKQVPKDQTVICEQCLSMFPVMWHCAAPHCSKKGTYLCKPCGKARFNSADHWLSCFSLSSEWDDRKEDAYVAVERITAMLKMERCKGDEEEEQEDAENEQEKHEYKDDKSKHVSKVEVGQSMDSSPISTADTSFPSSCYSRCSSEDGQRTPDSWQSQTSGPIRVASRDSLTSEPVCEEREQQSPDQFLERAEALEAQRANMHPNVSSFAGPSASFSQRSGTHQPALKSRPKSGRRSAKGHRALSSSGSCRRDGNLPALRGSGCGATSTALAFTEKAWRGSAANSLNDEELTEQDVDARNKYSTTPQKSLMATPQPALHELSQLLAAEPRRLGVSPRPRSLLGSPKEPKKPHDSPSTPRRSLVHQQLAHARASTPTGHPSVMTKRKSKLAKQSPFDEFGPLDQGLQWVSQATKPTL